MQASNPVGTRPAFCAGSCPPARATPHQFSHNSAREISPTFRTPAGSVEDPVPPGTARHTVPVSCREGRCAVCLHFAAHRPDPAPAVLGRCVLPGGTRGQVSWCTSRAAKRGCLKAPKSRIAFPPEARIARLQSTLGPLPCQSAQALRDRPPPARVFTQSGELLGR